MVSNISLNTTVVNQNRTQTTNNKNNNVVSIHQEKNKTNEYLNKEQKFTLKDPNTMQPKEWISTLKDYGYKAEKRKYTGYELLELVNSYYNKIANNDKNSDVVDFHIGSFCQNENNYNCTFLAALSTIPDKDIKKAITVTKDGNYEIKFPGDRNKEKITITKEEIANREITIDGKKYNNFSTGDMDVLILEMAALKRFGDIYSDGYNIHSITNEVKEATQIKSSNVVRGLFNKYNKSKEKINLDKKDLNNIKPGTIICLLNPMERMFMGLECDSKDVAYDSNNGITLNDDTFVGYNHAYSLIKYDKKEQKLYLGNPNNTTSVTEIPVSVLNYFTIIE